jgi:hypothetical protein
MTGYLVLTKGEASFALKGPLAMTRAVRRESRGQHEQWQIFRRQ